MSTESVMPSNHLILCHPLLLLPSVFPRIRVSSNELALRIRWSKYWSFSISPSHEYLGLISFRIDRFDLLAVQGTLKSLNLREMHSSQYMFYICRLKKKCKAYNLRIMIYLVNKTEDLDLEDSLSDNVEGLLQRGREE